MNNMRNSGCLFVLLAVLMCIVLMVYLIVSVPTQTEMAVMEYAESKGVSYLEYPSSLVELLERNPETVDFVLQYPFREEPAVDLRQFDRTLGVPLFLQWDRRWGYMEYGRDFVGVSGSGAMCLAMTGYFVTGDAVFSPVQIAAFAVENGYDSGWSVITEGGPALGLDVTEIAPVESKIAAYLRAGDPIIAVVDPGDFTDSSHAIVLTAYAEGRVTVNDPDSRENSMGTWSYASLADQIRTLWVIKADGED